MPVGTALVLLASPFAALAFAVSASGATPPSPWNAYYGYRGMTCSAALAALTRPAANVPVGYYGVEMVPTRRVPGTGNAVGVAEVTFSKSPYGVSITPDGTYVYDIALRVERLKRPERGVLTAWATKSDLGEVRRLGRLDENLEAGGTVAWNKFLLVVTLEPADAKSERWTGPIVMRGMSRSGLMHTLAGHGPYEKEPCSKYGFK